LVTDPSSGGAGGSRVVAGAGGSVVANIKIQSAVSIDVSQSQRGGGEGAGQARLIVLGKMGVSVIQKESRSYSNAVDEQIEVSVAIHIRQGGPGGELATTIHSGRGGDVLESAMAGITI
jgi:hypothetical protein